MKVELCTNDSEKYVGLLEIERYSDASGYCCQLVVRSGPFSGKIHFCFEPKPLHDFVEALERMNDHLTGTATLRPVYEEPFLTLTVQRTGAVDVSGELVQYGDHTHRMAFGFRTDQTCLGPFARDLRACMFAPAA